MSHVIEYISKTIDSLNHCLTDPLLSHNDIEWMKLKSQSLFTVVKQAQLTYPDIVNDRLIRCVKEIYDGVNRILQNYFENETNLFTVNEAPVFCQQFQPGRKKYQIKKGQLNCLLSLDFSIPEIAHFLGVSVRTIKRRMSEYEISVFDKYAEINDKELDVFIGNILREFPNTGYRKMIGYVRAKGYKIQEYRVRESLHRVDLEGFLERTIFLTTIQRRRYHVSGTNALWHIDGNHKLIR